jgi:K+-transporting ATPase A subunit
MVETILTIYFFITLITLMVIGLAALQGIEPDEVENIWDWLIYGIFWIIFPIKAIIKMFKKL